MHRKRKVPSGNDGGDDNDDEVDGRKSKRAAADTNKAYNLLERKTNLLPDLLNMVFEYEPMCEHEPDIQSICKTRKPIDKYRKCSSYCLDQKILRLLYNIENIERLVNYRDRLEFLHNALILAEDPVNAEESKIFRSCFNSVVSVYENKDTDWYDYFDSRRDGDGSGSDSDDSGSDSDRRRTVFDFVAIYPEQFKTLFDDILNCVTKLNFSNDIKMKLLKVLQDDVRYQAKRDKRFVVID